MVRRAGKTYFTESDDDNLIKYIAKVKPTNLGRQGNNIYITLEESSDQRPWAKRHSWQSWRERYRKNQDWFNHCIKKHQKKLKEEASEKQTEDREELYVELFGNSQISDDGGDESDVHEKPLDPSSFDDVVKIETPAAPIHPHVQEPASEPLTSSEQKSSAAAAPTALAGEPPQVLEVGGDESDAHQRLSAPPFDQMVKTETVPPAQEPPNPAISSGQKSSDAPGEIALTQPKYIRAKFKKIVSRDDDSNFFGTPSRSPSLLAANSTTPRGDPPVLTQGFYRNSLKRPRAAFGNVTNDESWPPKRRKKLAKDDNFRPDVEMSDACGKIKTNKAFSASLPEEGCANKPTLVCPPAQVNAVASSSKVPPPSYRPAKPTNLLKVIYAKGNPSSDTSYIHTDAPSLPEKAVQGTNLHFVKKNHDGHGGVAGSSSRYPVPIKYMQRLISSPDDDVDHQLARLSPFDIDDPFIADTSTPPVRKFNLPPHRIDLRKSLDNVTRRRRSRTSTTTSSMSRHSNSSFLPEDQNIFNQVGLQKVMAVIAKNYGFDVDVATKAYFATKSIEKTKSLLQFAKEVTNSATSALLSELVNNNVVDSSDDDGDDDEAPQNMRRNHSSPLPSGKDRQKRSGAMTNSGRQKAKRSLDGSRRKSNQLNIKPRPFDEEIDEMALSDYSPPRLSRAGQFLRLVKEGRREEAVDRERRRASGAFVVQTQTQALRYDDEDQSLAQQSSSQTLSCPRQPAAVDISPNVEPPIVAPHKEDIVAQQHLEQPPDDNISLPAVDDVQVDNVQVDDVQVDDEHRHRIFFKRISEGHSSLNEDEDDPEVLKLAQEHRDLVMNVMEDNADALRSFEQKHNQDLLRLWSLDWVRQKIADI